MKLYDSLIADLASAGADVEGFTLVLRPFHSRNLGLYSFRICRVVVYIFEDKARTTYRPYAEILETAIHEAAHHATAGSKVRGRSHHHEDFWDAYHVFNKQALRLGLYDKRITDKGDVVEIGARRSLRF